MGGCRGQWVAVGVSGWLYDQWVVVRVSGWLLGQWMAVGYVGGCKVSGWL